MTLEPTPTLLDNLYWITLLAVVVSSASGVLKAGFKQFDLFGVIIIAIATGLGGWLTSRHASGSGCNPGGRHCRAGNLYFAPAGHPVQHHLATIPF